MIFETALSQLNGVGRWFVILSCGLSESQQPAELDSGWPPSTVTADRKLRERRAGATPY